MAFVQTLQCQSMITGYLWHLFLLKKLFLQGEREFDNRCVCKSWLNLTHDSQLITMHLHRSSENKDNLTLIFVNTIHVNLTLFQTRLSFLDNNGGTNDHYDLCR
ncbi:hypothetical protein ACSBR1_012185 [Camellia fascicularis]